MDANDTRPICLANFGGAGEPLPSSDVSDNYDDDDDVISLYCNIERRQCSNC